MIEQLSLFSHEELKQSEVKKKSKLTKQEYRFLRAIARKCKGWMGVCVARNRHFMTDKWSPYLRKTDRTIQRALRKLQDMELIHVTYKDAYKTGRQIQVTTAGWDVIAEADLRRAAREQKMIVIHGPAPRESEGMSLQNGGFVAEDVAQELLESCSLTFNQLRNMTEDEILKIWQDHNQRLFEKKWGTAWKS